MNRERLQQVRDRIAAEPPERLNMQFYSDECGTAFCICGWSAVVDGRGPNDVGMYEEGVRLGLNEEQADKLFTPRKFSIPGAYTKDDALAALDSLINADSDDALPVWPEPRA